MLFIATLAFQSCKKWIFDNCQTDQLREAVLTYLLSRFVPQSFSINAIALE